MKYGTLLCKPVLALLYIFFSFQVNAQTGRFYSTDDGLSNSLINDVHQDREGYIWIATEYGLNKFNGYDFINYYHVPGDTTSLDNSYVRTLFEDRQGTLYIGTLSGLMKYNRGTDSFERIPVYSREGKLVQVHVSALLEMENGDMLVATSGRGLFRIEKDCGRCVHYTALSDRLSSNFLNSMVQDPQGTVWIGTGTDGLNRYNPVTGGVTVFEFPGNSISALVVDHRGVLYVGAQTKGLYKYNEVSTSFESVSTGHHTELFIKSLRVDAGNYLYIATDGQGLKIYDPLLDRLEDWVVPIFPFDFEGEKVHTVLFDHAQNMWLGIFRKGIVFSPVAGKRFDYLGHKLYRNNPIGFSCVTAIRKDREGILWIGTDSDGLYGVNGDGEQVAHYRSTTAYPSVPDIIQSIYEDKQGNLWLGSYADGLVRMDKKTGRCTAIPALADARVFYITGDDDGSLWIATYSVGICRLDPQTEEIEYFPFSRETNDDLFIDELPNNAVNTLLCDGDLVWTGHFDGLSCYDTKRRTFLTLNQQNNMLPGQVVLTIQESMNGELLVGTANGFYLLDKQTLDYTHYTMADGLPSDVICGIAEDRSGAIWFSTYQGISKYDRAENRFINYSGEEVIQGNEFTRGAQFTDETGKIWFGGVNGVTGFYPGDVIDIESAPSLLITRFYLNGRAVKMGDRSGRKEIIKHPVTEAGEYHLAWQDNNFRIEFASMNYEMTDRIVYQYQLEGVDTDWQTTHQGSNWVAFNNLPPGNYRLKVRAQAGGNYSPEKRIRIYIAPPWYQTRWAYLLYGVFILLLGYIIFYTVLSHFRYKQEVIKREYSDKINESKLQFFTNVSHEIRSPMTLIIHPLEKLIRDLQEKEGDHTTLLNTYIVIHRNAQRILRLVNQLMDVRKLEKGQMKIKCRETDIVGFIEDLMRTYDYLARQKKIRFSFVHAMPELKAWVDLNHFDKVLVNVFSNAFKYTPEGGEIVVSLTEETDTSGISRIRKYFEIRVTDTGIGIDPDKLEAIFERFYQVNEDPYSNFGTGIGLHLSRSLVHLHKGKIYAENRTGGKGSCFVVRLPLGNEHLKPEEFVQGPPVVLQEDALSARQSMETLYEEKEEKGVKSKTRYRILISEDDEEIRSYLQNQLAPDYHVTCCGDGRKALDYLLKESFDLLISDIMMPEMDGLTLCRKVKKNIRISHIPVVLLTARAQTEDKLEGLKQEADAYLVKPFDPEILKYTISNLIANRQRLKNKFSGQEEQEVVVDTGHVKSPDELLLERVINLITENLSNPALNVEMLARTAGLSRVHMHRKLKTLTNQSPSELIRNTRLKHASTLLKSRKYTITDVAYATGFTNLSHFSTSFKEFYGISPTEYLQQKE
ncbi:MAG: response regulator [Tannerellaceae bacterium]|nr:response regulator [Tannerellaceae bacterium]